MTITKPNPIPDASVPVIVPPSGRANTDWFSFFGSLATRLNLLITMIGTGSTVVASLPAAATAGAGARAFVTDATATTFHSTVAGGGSNKVPVCSDGTNWLIG